jgi:hypothetical protein
MKTRMRWLVAGLLGLVLLGLSYPVSSKLEERDSFCISCHTVPEETYYNRAQETLSGNVEYPPDLASAHYAVESEMNFRCIDCHRGDQSSSHRWQTFLLGARDALVWVSGQADPTIEKVHAGEPMLLNAGCVPCHTESLLELGFNNHFHNQLRASGELIELGYEAFEPPEGIPGTLFTELAENEAALDCIDCHQAHRTIPDGDLTLYLDLETVMFPACVQCHEEVGQGPLELQ